MVTSIYGNNLVSEGISDTLMDGSTRLSQSKYARRIVKRIGMKNVSYKRTPAPTHLKVSKKISGERVDKCLCESSVEGWFIWRSNLIPWISKKQNCVFLYNIGAEHIAADSNCSKMIWMKQIVIEYNVIQDVMTLNCDIAPEASQFKTLRDKLGTCQYEEL